MRSAPRVPGDADVDRDARRPTTRRATAWAFGLACVVLAGVIARLAFISALGRTIDADEAVNGLMALAISRGHELPVFTWEAHYGGAIIPYVAAGIFRALEPSPFTLRLAALPLAAVGIAAVADAARTIWGRGPGLLAGVWVALGPPVLMVYSSRAIGGYPEVLAFGGLTVAIAARIALHAREPRSARPFGALGFSGGLGTYSLPFVLPLFAGVVLALRATTGRLSRSAWLRLVAGFLIGMAPALAYNVSTGGASLLRLGGRVLDVGRADIGRTGHAHLLVSKGTEYVRHLAELPVTLAGNMPRLLGLPRATVLGVLLAVAAVAFLGGRAQSPADRFGRRVVAWCALATLAFVWGLRLDAERHLFPFTVPLALAVAGVAAAAHGRWRVVAATAFAVMLAVNAAGTVLAARDTGPRLDPLLGALAAEHARFVYTGYYIAYPLVFVSGGAIVASPAAGPVNVERRAALTAAVAAAPRPAYVFDAGSAESAVFAREMARLHRAVRRRLAGPFDVYLPADHVDPRDMALVREF